MTPSFFNCRLHSRAIFLACTVDFSAYIFYFLTYIFFFLPDIFYYLRRKSLLQSL